MNKKMKSLTLIVMCASFFFTACKKECFDKSLTDFGNEDAVMILESGYNSSVVITPEHPSDFKYYTKGFIEYSKNGNVIANVDYGDGTKDVWAKISKNGKSEDFDLSAKKKDATYTKVITKPLIKIEGCDYIVEGTIKYFKGNDWVASVDYGNGTCDEWATKTLKDGSEIFSMKKK